MSAPSPDQPPEQKPAAPSLMQAMLSVLASFFGVQSEKNRQRDFSSGKPMVFIGLAIAFTVIFIVTLVVIVKLMLRNAGM
jgi:hypothetical protein